MSKTRWADTVPKRVDHAPLRPGIFRCSTATRASSPTLPGSRAFANRPTEKAEKTSGTRGRGGSMAEGMTGLAGEGRTQRRMDDGRPGESAGDHREEVQRDGQDHPLPLHSPERAADRRE